MVRVTAIACGLVFSLVLATGVAQASMYADSGYGYYGYYDYYYYPMTYYPVYYDWDYGWNYWDAGYAGYGWDTGYANDQYCYAGYGCYPFAVDDPHQWIQDSWTGEWY